MPALSGFSPDRHAEKTLNTALICIKAVFKIHSSEYQAAVSDNSLTSYIVGIIRSQDCYQIRYIFRFLRSSDKDTSRAFLETITRLHMIVVFDHFFIYPVPHGCTCHTRTVGVNPDIIGGKLLRRRMS